MANMGTQAALKVADEVWIVTALLHRENPEARDFSIDEIVSRAKREGLHKPYRRGVYVHVVQHCVANRPPNTGRYRMLFETGPGRRRLFRKGDANHPARDGAKITPDVLPKNHSGLAGWYRGWSARESVKAFAYDPLLSLQGSGKHLWSDEHGAAYLRRVREG